MLLSRRNSQYYILSLLACFLLLLFPLTILSDGLDDATEEAVEILAESGLSKSKISKFYIEIRNFDSDKIDRDALIIQGRLYTALRNYFPKAEIFQVEDSIAGVPSNVILILGKYRLMGAKTLITLEAKNTQSSTLIAKAVVKLDSLRQVEEDLVVVMDIFSPYLMEKKPGLDKSYSRIFRSALSSTKKFNLVSSDAVDSADADKIQKKYKCTREECGTIIAQQLRASKTINVTYEKIDDRLFYLNGSVKDMGESEFPKSSSFR